MSRWRPARCPLRGEGATLQVALHRPRPPVKKSSSDRSGYGSLGSIDPKRRFREYGVGGEELPNVSRSFLIRLSGTRCPLSGNRHHSGIVPMQAGWGSGSLRSSGSEPSHPTRNARPPEEAILACSPVGRLTRCDGVPLAWSAPASSVAHLSLAAPGAPCLVLVRAVRPY
jgi:hypothetical protein